MEAGTFVLERKRRRTMNNIIYLVGLVVIVIAVLSFFGLG
jgi:predicted nucleic acid-binding Zn ribbon protein